MERGTQLKHPKNKRDIKDIIDSQTHNTFDANDYDEDSFAFRYAGKRKDNTLTELNHTYGDIQSTESQKATKSKQPTSVTTHKSINDGYQSKERTIEYADQSDEDTHYQTHSSKLKKIKSKGNLKSKFDLCQRFKATDYTDEPTYSTQQSFRDYQPTQKGSRQLSRRRAQVEDQERYQHSPAELDKYPTFNNEDSLYNLSDSEFPSKIVEKQLRTKSLENQSRVKRSRMGNYLQQVPKNSHNKEVSPYHRKQEQYMTHQMISVHDKIDSEYKTKGIYEDYSPTRNASIERRPNGNRGDSNGPSLNIPQKMKNGQKSKKSLAQTKMRHKAKNSEISYEENVPENVMKNVPKEHSSRGNKHQDLVRALKEREAQERASYRQHYH